MKVISIYWIAVFTLLIAFWSCDKGTEEEEEIVPVYLVDQELNEEASLLSSTIKSRIEFFGLADIANKAKYDALAEKVKYDIDVYTITYKTAFEGDSILVSGLVAIPISTNTGRKYPILSYQHGTLFQKSEAPTENVTNEFMTYVASTGMVVVIADYIGFGQSNNVFHPYMNKQYTVNAVLDMIRASKEFIEIDKPCLISDDLYLFGYSQGGSATVAALSAIENSKANSDLKVTFASAGGGAYDLNEFRKSIMRQQLYEKPSYVTYILESFSRYSDINIDYSQIFSENFAPTIPGLIDGIKSEGTINSSFGTFYVDELFNNNFVNDSIFENDNAYAALKMAFTDNRIGAWSLNASLALYFGTDDKWVPGAQSIKLYQEFQQYNVGSKIKYKPLNGMDHTSAFMPALIESIDWFLVY